MFFITNSIINYPHSKLKHLSLSSKNNIMEVSVILSVNKGGKMVDNIELNKVTCSANRGGYLINLLMKSL